MNKITSAFISLLVAASAALADFNVTNYPAVASIKDRFAEYKAGFPGAGDYSHDIVSGFWKQVPDADMDAFFNGLVQIGRDNPGFDFFSLFSKPYVAWISTNKLAALDAALTEVGGVKAPQYMLWNLYNNDNCDYYKMPRIHDAWWNSTNIVSTRKAPFAVHYAVYHRYAKFADIPFEAKINITAATIASGRADKDYAKRNVFGKLQNYLKRKFRDQGKTFFVDETTGENPLQSAVDEFIAAFNAPRLAGLKELVAKWNPNYEWIDVPESLWLTPEKLDALKDKVYYGEVEFTGEIKMKLAANMGLEAFNAFVRHYNGEE